jgi:ring-1,2-phenylacetyl-CoA epoxidase subunit PaaE
MSSHFHSLKINQVVKNTNDTVVVTFDVPEQLKSKFHFKQGQYLTVEKEINGALVRRSYSICTSPFDNQLSVAIKQVENGIFSTYANNNLKQGDILQVMEPNGKFYTELTVDAQKSYLTIACGSGITPIISIIKTILVSEPNSQVTLVYSNSKKQSIIFLEALEALKNKHVGRFQIIYLLSREQTESPINFGRIDEQKLTQLQKLIDYQKVDDFFICGPETVILNTKAFLVSKNINEKQIHFELFGTQKNTKQKTQSDSVINTVDNSEVSIIVDGRTLTFNIGNKNQNILDAALAQGADLPYACKGGVCSTCKAKLIEGKVHMDINYALEKEEVEQGYILTCQSHPTTSKVLVDFDIK